MKRLLKHIATLSTGIYAKPDILADTLYLQGNHFSEFGFFDSSVRPQLKLAENYEKHLLQNDDILFAAKGLNNFAVVYHNSIGQAVASSSFIVIRLSGRYKHEILPEYLAWYINNSKQVPIFHKLKATTTIPSISIAQLLELELNIPSKTIQKQVVNFQQLREKEKDITRRLELLKDQLTHETLLKAIKK